MNCIKDSTIFAPANYDLDAFDDQQAEKLFVDLRWPQSVRCPQCDNTENATIRRTPKRSWRCSKCGYIFSVTSKTLMHGSKASCVAWLTVAICKDEAQLHLSIPNAATRRRLLRVACTTGLPPGKYRLHAMLHNSGKVNTCPEVLKLSSGQRRVIQMLRTRMDGATIKRIASKVWLSESHTRRCLNTLRMKGYVKRVTRTVSWGHDTVTIHLWQLEYTAFSHKVIGTLPWVDDYSVDCDPAKLPGEFWREFWSGGCASNLRLPQHARHIASTLIGGPDVSAHNWALLSIPVETLKELRVMPGYENGWRRDALDATIRIRSNG